MKYELYYDRWKIAKITQNYADFSTFLGSYKLEAGLEKHPETKKVSEYIDYSIRMCSFVEADKTNEINYEEEQRYIEIIESPNWRLIGQNGEKIAILAPAFCTNNEINWRIDSDR